MTIAGRSEFLASFDVSRETIEKFDQLHADLQKWSRKINLVSPSTLNTAWQRHIIDSAQLFQYIPETAKDVADLGSGGGFPGLVLAAMSMERNPETTFHLVESDARKCAFLINTSRKLRLPVKVQTKRIEEAEPLMADVVVTRALAPLYRLMPWVKRHISADGMAVLPKGKDAEKELSDVAEEWSFELEKRPSITHPDAVVLLISELRKKSN